MAQCARRIELIFVELAHVRCGDSGPGIGRRRSDCPVDSHGMVGWRRCPNAVGPGSDRRRRTVRPNLPKPESDGISYLVAKGGEPTAHRGGDNPAISLLSVVGSKPPSNVTVNEFTTVASVWTHNQFIDGTAIQATCSDCALPPAMSRISSICKPAAGARQFRIRSTAARLRRWQISRPWPICLPVASRE